MSNKANEFKKNKFMKKVFMENRMNNGGWDNPFIFESMLMHIIHVDEKEEEFYIYMSNLLNSMPENQKVWKDVITQSFDNISKEEFNLLLPFCGSYILKPQSLLFLTVLKNIFDHTNIELCNETAKNFIREFAHAKMEELENLPEEKENSEYLFVLSMKILLTIFVEQCFLTNSQINPLRERVSEIILNKNKGLNALGLKRKLKDKESDIIYKGKDITPPYMFKFLNLGDEFTDVPNTTINNYPLLSYKAEEINQKVFDTLSPMLNKCEKCNIVEEGGNNIIKNTTEYVGRLSECQIAFREEQKEIYKPLIDEIIQQIKEKMVDMTKSYNESFLTPYDLFDESPSSSRQASPAYTIRKNISNTFLGLMELKSLQSSVEFIIDCWQNISTLAVTKALIFSNIKYLPSPYDLFDFINGMLEYNVNKEKYSKKIPYEAKGIFKQIGIKNIRKLYDILNINYIDAIITDMTGRNIYEMAIMDARIGFTSLKNSINTSQVIDDYNDLSEKYENIEKELKDYKNADTKIASIKKELKNSESRVHDLLKDKKELKDEIDKLKKDIEILTIIDDGKTEDEGTEDEEVAVEVNENIIQELSQKYKIAFVAGHEKTVNRLKEKIPNLYIAKGIETYRDIKESHIKNCDFIFFSTAYSKHNAYFYIKKMTEKYNKEIYYINVENASRIINIIFQTIIQEIENLKGKDLLRSAT